MLTSHAAKDVLAGGLADKKDATMPPKDHRDPPRENWLGNCYEQLPTQQQKGNVDHSLVLTLPSTQTQSILCITAIC
jgi:hypothetical protein